LTLAGDAALLNPLGQGVFFAQVGLSRGLYCARGGQSCLEPLTATVDHPFQDPGPLSAEFVGQILVSIAFGDRDRERDQMKAASDGFVDAAQSPPNTAKLTGQRPGDLLGTAQSGLPALKIGDLKRDASLMRRARAAAMAVFETDPRLELSENQRFRHLIVEQQGQTFSHVS